jgi:hypothetical protein
MTKPNMEHWPKEYQNDHWCELGIDAFCEVHGRDPAPRPAMTIASLS